jgi:hypothetical protein
MSQTTTMDNKRINEEIKIQKINVFMDKRKGIHVFQYISSIYRIKTTKINYINRMIEFKMLNNEKLMNKIIKLK